MFSQIGQREIILEKISDCLSRQPAPRRRLNSQMSMTSEKDTNTVVVEGLWLLVLFKYTTSTLGIFY